MDILTQPIEKTVRISSPYLKRLHQVGVFCLRDLFYYAPTRYLDFSKTIPIARLKLDEPATVSGCVFDIKNQRTWRKRMVITTAIIQDSSGFLKAIWFNQPFMVKNLKKGDSLNLAGTLSLSGKEPIFSNPSYEKLTGAKTRNTGRLVPIYRETRGLTSRWLRFFIQKALGKYASLIRENLPQDLLEQENLLSLKKSLEQIHFPDSLSLLAQAQKRLSFEELFLLQLFLLRKKIGQQQQRSPAIKFNQSLIKKFVDSLPFKLTAAQKKAAWEILKDVAKKNSMNRLLEGDVGSGKTVVAAIALLQTAHNGFQGVLMAPTDILAQQHFSELLRLFKGQRIKSSLLTSKKACLDNKKCPKKELLEKINEGGAGIVVGTHALIQKNVRFNNLALVIIDEQHRFGVRQRASLQKEAAKAKDGLPQTIPHLLSMTATPIPRTLALTVYGDLDISLLDELPKDRKAIKTFVVPPEKRLGAYDFIRSQVEEGRQIFIVCPRIDGGNPQKDNLDCAPEPKTAELLADKRKLAWQGVKAVIEEHSKLQKIFPEFLVSLLHGKMKAPEKEKIMNAYRQNKINILVSTSVIEAGIDIPNAAVIVIEDADRFGLAQLHQFRGRVGRGEHQSYCFLFSGSNQPETLKRLEVLKTSRDGFELAEKDLLLRGPGEFIGEHQSGLPDVSMASLTNIGLIKKARQAALNVLTKDPQLKNLPAIKTRIEFLERQVHRE